MLNLWDTRSQLAEALNVYVREQGSARAREQVASKLLAHVDKVTRRNLRRRAAGWGLTAQDVEDLCQETVLGFLRSLERGQLRHGDGGVHTPDSVARYIYGISANSLLAHLRKQGRYRATRASVLRRLADALRRFSGAGGQEAPGLKLEVKKCYREFLESYSVNGLDDPDLEARYLEKLVESAQKPVQADFESWIHAQAAAVGMTLRERPPGGLVVVDSVIACGNEVRDIIAELPSSGQDDTGESLWLRLRELTGTVTAGNIVITFLIGSNVAPAQLNRLWGAQSSPNTPRNNVIKVENALRAQRSANQK